MGQTFLGQTFNIEEYLTPQIKNKLKVNEAKIKQVQANIDAGRPGNWEEQLRAAKADTAYYTTGKGAQEMFADWKLEVAGGIGKSLGLSASQLVTNPGLVSDATALSKYAGTSLSEAQKRIASLSTGISVPIISYSAEELKAQGWNDPSSPNYQGGTGVVPKGGTGVVPTGTGGQVYEEKLKSIAEQLRIIQGKTVGLTEQTQRAGQMQTIAPEKFTSKTEIPETYNYQKAYGTGQFSAPKASAITKPNVDLHDYEDLSIASNADGSTDTIIARTGVMPEVGMPETPIPYFGGAQEAWQDVNKRLQELATSAETPSDTKALVEEQFEKWGIEESFNLLQDITTQATSVRKQLDSIIQQEQVDLANSEDRGMSMSYIIGEKNRIAEAAYSKKSVLAAELSGYAAEAAMIRGNVTLAKGFAMELVNAATYDAEIDYKRLYDVYQLEQDMFADLAENEREVYEAQMDQAEAIWKQAKDERQQIVDWATDKDLAPAFYGVDLSRISFDDAAKLVSEYAGMQAVAGGEDILSVAEAKSLGVPYGTTKTEAYGLVPGTGPGSLTTEVVEIDGKQVLINKKTGATIRVLGAAPVKDPSMSQATAAGFATRVVDSNNIFDELDAIPGFDATSIVERKKPQIWKSVEMQRQEQAERNYVNAVLRRESGAAISPEEFASAEIQYFPRWGDSDAVLKQKRDNRKRVEQNLINESGAAYTGASMGGVFAVTAPDGSVWEFSSQKDADDFQREVGGGAERGTEDTGSLEDLSDWWKTGLGFIK